MLEAASRLPYDHQRARIKILGIPDRFIEHMTSRDEQLAKIGLDAKGIVKSVLASRRANLV